MSEIGFLNYMLETGSGEWIVSQNNVRISQCMIVKNEERNIQRALSWGKNVIWEQIVVDTGSTDRTVELAKAMGAKVYHFSWIDDFAAAKNYAISKASGDWIAFLDADEYLMEEWVSKMPELLQRLESSCYAIRSPLVNLQASSVTLVARHCRIFRRMPGLGYRGAIHEYLVLEGRSIDEEHLYDTAEEFPVFHTGYTDQEIREKKKKERNIRILKKELEKNPGAYHIMGYLGDDYFHDKEQTGEAESWYRKAIACMPMKLSEGDERSALTFINLLLFLVQKDMEEEKILEIYRLARQRVPWVYDIDHILGRYYLGKANIEKVVYHFEKGLQVAEQYGDSAYGIYMMKDIVGIWEVLAKCYYQLGELKAAMRYCVELLGTDNRQFDILILLMRLLNGEKMDEVLKFLGRLYNIKEPFDRIFLLRAAVRLQAGGLIQELKKECTREELAYLEEL